MTTLPTLADEIISLLVSHPRGLSIANAASELSVPALRVRDAFITLHSTKRAVVAKRGQGGAFFLHAAGYPACFVCHRQFARGKKSKRITCGRSCAVSLSWRSEDARKNRLASIIKERRTPVALARTKAANDKRWSRPGERERLSEANRLRWADPTFKAKTSASIQAVNGSAQARARSSLMRKEQWKDPKFRQATVAGIRKSKQSDEARAKFSDLTKARWRDPEWRKKWLPAVRRNAAKAGRASQAKRKAASQKVEV